MKIRTVKPEFWASHTMSRVSRDARLLFIGLLNEADDYGRLLGSPKRLAGILFPHDEDVGPAEVRGWLDQLGGAGLVQRYDDKYIAYIAVCGFSEHQKIDKRYASRLPAPPAWRDDAPPTSPQSIGGEPVGPADESEGNGRCILDLGSGILELDPGREDPDARAPASKPTEPPEPETESDRRGLAVMQVLRESHAAVPRSFKTSGGRAGFEENMNRGAWFDGPDDLLAVHGADFARAAPMLDGKGAPRRPTVALFVTSKWGAFVAARSREGGQASALAALQTWLVEAAEKHRRAWEHHGGAPTEETDPVRRRARKAWDALRQRGDVGPFDPWFSIHRGRYEQPGSERADVEGRTAGDDTMDPAEVRQLLAATKPGAKVGKALPPARARPSGGEIPSGGVT